jgi:hypothetical protein
MGNDYLIVIFNWAIEPNKHEDTDNQAYSPKESDYPNPIPYKHSRYILHSEQLMVRTHF